MIKSLREISLLDILPPNLLEDKKIYAAAKALDLELGDITDKTKLVLHLPRLDELPDEVLNLLAWQFHCDLFKSDLGIEVKRNLIRESIAWHRIKGTPAAVEKAISTLLAPTEISEWFEYGGEPYRFKPIINLTDARVVFDGERKAELYKTIAAMKNVRSWLDGVVIKVNPAGSGDSSSDSETVEVYEEPVKLFAAPTYEEIVPYGGKYTATRYDGSVRCGEFYTYNGELQYNGQPLFTGLKHAERYAKNNGWWLVPNGNSRFNREFKYDGAIHYDGLRPYKIEYNDGMDELKLLEVEPKIEEEVSRTIKCDGSVRFDNNVKYATLNVLPTDSSGDIEITKHRCYNGAIKYDGAGLNKFDGSLKFNGLFNYSGGGERARTEVFKDNISGNLQLKSPEKDEPLVLKYPELFDDVPKATESYKLDVNIGAVANEEVGHAIKCNGSVRFNGGVNYDGSKHTVIDDGGKLEITKGRKYDGSIQYNGGDINYFNGSIKANGNFSYNGGGNSAKIEVISVDLTDNFSLTRKTKGKPFNYVEHVDNVEITESASEIGISITFKDSIELDDEGKLIIRRRIKYDGSTQYHRDLIYKANGKRKYDGSTSYDGLSRVKVDGSARYNQSELYGGRPGSTDYVEYVLDLEELPIATRSKLGYVIAGDNLDIDDGGLITLSQRLRAENLIELESGRLATILENRRQKHEV